MRIAMMVAACAAASLHADPLPKSSEIVRRYVPAARLDAVMAVDRRGALLPLEQFEELLKQAHAQTDGQPQLPAAPVLAQADYAATLDGDRLKLTAKLQIRTFRKGWQVVPIHVGGLGVLNATIGEGDASKPAQVARDPQSPDDLAIFLTEPGRQVVTLELVAPLNAVGSDRSAAFQLSGAPTGLLTVTTPANQRLAVDTILMQRPAPDDQPSEYAVPIGGRGQIALTLTERRSSDRADVVTFASTAIGVIASPGEATWTARTRLSVFGRPIDRLECEVPTALEITGVESAGLESWQLADAGNGRTRITLSWRQPYDGVRPITFRGVFAPEADGRWTVPNLELNDVASHTGVVMLQRPAGVRVQILQSTGLRQMSADEARQRVEPGEPTTEDATALFFQMWREDFTLDFRPAEKAREVQAAMTTLLSLDSQGTDLLTTIDFSTRFAPLFEADVDLPAAWQLSNVTVAGQPVDWQVIPHEAGRNRIRVALNPPLLPGEQRNMTLTAHFEPEGWPVEEEPIRLPIPEIRLPQAGVVEALYGVAAGDDLDLAPIDVVGLDPARRLDIEALNRQLAPFGKAARLGFTYQDTVFQGQLEVRRMPARLAVTSVVLTRIEGEAVLSHVEAQLQIGGGGLRELRVTLPEGTGSDVRFRLTPYRPFPVFGAAAETQVAPNAAAQVALPPLPNILEQQAGTAANGVVPWTIKLDRYARGLFVLQAELSQPRPAAAAGGAPPVTVPGLTVPGAERESGAIGIEAADDQHLVVTTRSAGGRALEPVDPIDFPPAHARPRERLVATYAFDRPGWSVSIAEEKLAREAMPTALVHSLKLQSLLDSTGSRQTQADADLVAVGVQSLRVELPEGQQIWTALVDGAPVEVRREGEAFAIPLSPVQPPERHRAVRLIYAPERAAGAPVPEISRDGLRLADRPPQFSVVTGQGTAQPLEILESSWTLYHPPQWDLAETNGVYHPANAIRRESAAHRLLSMFAIPTAERAFVRFGLLGGVVLLLAIVAFVRRLRTSEMMKGIAALVVITAVIAFLLPMTQTRNATSFRGGTDVRFSDGSVATMSMPESAPYVTPPVSGGAAARMTPARGLVLPDAAVNRDELLDLNSKAAGVPSFAAPMDAAQPPAAQDSESLVQKTIEPQAQVLFGAEAPAKEPLPAAKPTDMRGESRTTVALAHQGLLSVSFALESPAGFVAEAFRTTATTEPASNRLDVEFVDRDSQWTFSLLIALAVAVLGWWLRAASASVRILFLLLVGVAPIAVRNLVPVTVLPFLDGVWLGGLIAATLWVLRAIVLQIAPLFDPEVRVAPPAPTVPPAAAVLIAFALFGSSAFAQEPPAADKAAEEPRPPQPPTVFVPYGDPADPLSARNVYVPRKLFLELWHAAHPDEVPPGPAPREGVVSAASFVVDLQQITANASSPKAGSSASVQARFLIHNFQEGPTRLGLPLRNVAVRTATLDGEPAVVDVDAGSGQLVVVVPKRGPAVLDLAFDVPVESTGPAGRLAWENDLVAAGRLTVRLPAGNLDVRLNGTRTNAARPEGEAGAVLEIPVDRGGPQAIAWQPPTELAASDSPVQLTTVMTAAIDDTGLTLRSTFSVRLRQGSVSELTFGLPAAVRLKKVEGLDVAGWRVDGEGEGRKLTVSFLRKIDTQTDFMVEVFQPLEIADQPISASMAPLLPEGVARESGRIGVYIEPHLAVRPTDARGLNRDEVTQFAVPMDAGRPPATSQLQYVYRYSQRPVGLDLLIERRQAETKAVVQHGVLVSRRKQQPTSRIAFQIAGAPRSTVSVALPPGFLLVDVTSDLMSDYSVSDEAGGVKLLNVELAQPRTGEVVLLIDGVIPRQPDEPTASLAIPVPQNVARLESELAVWVDDVYTASVNAAADWRSMDPAGLSDSLKSLRSTAVQFAFRATTPAPAPITISLEQQSPELTADLLTLIAVDDAAVEYGLTFQWKITRAASDTFTFTTPGWLRGRLDFAGAGIRQISSVDAPNDRVRWTISLTDPVRDRFLLTAAASLPMPADDVVAAPAIEFESIGQGNAPAPLEFQRQFAVVVNLSRNTLALLDSGAVETVTRENLPLKLPDALVQQAMSLVRILPGRAATWGIRRLEAAVMAQATVTAASLESIVDWDGSWRTKATYTVRNRGRQYLPLEFAEEGGRVLSVVVKGQPARTVATPLDGRTLHLVPLPPSSEADLSFDVVVNLAGKLPQPLPTDASIESRTLMLPAPRIPSPSESAEFGVPVAQTAWTVTLPGGVEATIDDTSNLIPHQTSEWGLVADSQRLSLFEGEIAEMSRIVTDTKASYSQKVQAKNNLRQLSLAVQSYSESYRGDQKPMSSKSAELYDQNSDRFRQLQRRVETELSKSEAAPPATAFTVQNGTGVAIPFRQGSFNLGVPQAGNPQSGSGSDSPPQAVEGKFSKEFILGNSVQILSDNDGLTVHEADSAAEFGFNAVNGPPAGTTVLEEKAKNDFRERDRSLSSGGRRSLRAKAQQQAIQEQAPGQSDFSGRAGALGAFSRSSGGALGGQAGGEAQAMDPSGMGQPAEGTVLDQFDASWAFSPGAAEFDRLQVFGGEAEGVPARPWTQAGGLSLLMTQPSIPGNAFGFSKSGGNPTLILKTRSVATRTTLWSFIEAAGWLVAAIWLFVALRRPERFPLAIAILIAAGAAVSFVLLPGGERWLAFVVFLIAACAASYFRSKASQPVAA